MLLLTPQIFVELVELHTLHEERPPQFSVTGAERLRSCAATCQITREDGAIIESSHGRGCSCKIGAESPWAIELLV